MDFASLRTEQSNKRSREIDQLSSYQIAEIMNDEDSTVASAVNAELNSISDLIDLAVNCIEQNGRIFYIGAGTSGRLGVLDASEIPPTFNTSPDQFIGIIAGGMEALHSSVPNLEDDAGLGEGALQNYNINHNDLVIGLTASGSSQFVYGAVIFAKSNKAKTGLICCNKLSALGKLVDVAVEINTGPEVILGSTRLKAGTAQKMTLNIFSTGTMIKVGKVYKNYMIDFQTTNSKLFHRALYIIKEATGVSMEQAEEIFELTNRNIKASIVLAITDAEIEKINDLLAQYNGRIRDVLAKLMTK
jgi:N-acetylmuramic acid 6-phosphate etherase